RQDGGEPPPAALAELQDVLIGERSAALEGRAEQETCLDAILLHLREELGEVVLQPVHPGVRYERVVGPVRAVGVDVYYRNSRGPASLSDCRCFHRFAAASGQVLHGR